MGLQFHTLLVEKEPRALLILAYWLALMSRIPQWWIVGRSRHECAAICAFLRSHPDPRLRALLEVPERICLDSLNKDRYSKPSFEKPWENLDDESCSLGAMGNFGNPVPERRSTHLSEKNLVDFHKLTLPVKLGKVTGSLQPRGSHHVTQPVICNCRVIIVKRVRRAQRSNSCSKLFHPGSTMHATACSSRPRLP